MKTIHTEIDIGAPADVVWEVISNLEGWEGWNPIMKASGTLAHGARPTIIIAPPGRKEIQVQPKISHFAEGEEFRWRTGFSFPGIFQAEHGFKVIPDGGDTCRFEQVEMMSGLLAGRMMARSGKEINTGFQVMNRMLKRESEKRSRKNA